MCQIQTLTKDLINRTLIANCVALPTEALDEDDALLNKKNPTNLHCLSNILRKTGKTKCMLNN